GGELPFITMVLVGVATFIRSNIIWLIPLVVGAYIAIRLYVRVSDSARVKADQLKLRLPFIGKMWTKFSISQLMRTLHTLLSGGIPLVNAIDVAASAVGNRLISGRLSRVSQSVKEGEPLWSSLHKTNLMTPMAVEMVKVGEETGALEEMLKNISDFYDEEIDSGITSV